MRPSQASAILPILLASCAFAALEKRQTNDAVGTIISPANGSSITPGTPFSFQYSDGWGGACHPAYTPISVGITAYRPTWPDLNGSIFKLPDSDYLYYFGDYVILNDEGIPPMSNPPPPSTFTLPELDPMYNGQEIYLSVAEQMFECVPAGHTVYSFPINSLQYNP